MKTHDLRTAIILLAAGIVGCSGADIQEVADATSVAPFAATTIAPPTAITPESLQQVTSPLEGVATDESSDEIEAFLNPFAPPKEPPPKPEPEPEPKPKPKSRPRKTPLQKAETLLGLKGKYDEKAFKSAYRKKLKAAHPDLGGSEKKTVAVVEAIELIRKHHGWS